MPNDRSNFVRPNISDNCTTLYKRQIIKNNNFSFSINTYFQYPLSAI